MIYSSKGGVYDFLARYPESFPYDDLNIDLIFILLSFYIKDNFTCINLSFNL